MIDWEESKVENDIAIQRVMKFPALTAELPAFVIFNTTKELYSWLLIKIEVAEQY
jgi:hypothetical protein